MRNLLIVGSGRSGTSLMAGLLAHAGYYMGEELLAARKANPKGFFESRNINRLNEDLITSGIPRRIPMLWRLRYGRPPEPLRRWVARLPLSLRLQVTPDLEQRVRAAVAMEPFCYKDPRLCYSLGAWLPHLHNTGIVCVFRHPVATANSIVLECQEDRNLRSVDMTFPRAIQLWRLMYTHLMRHYATRSHEWMFVHYDQLLSGTAFDSIESFCGAAVDRSFPDPALKRSRADAGVPLMARRLYRRLCQLARFEI